jgi:hypothetical protein
MEAGVRGPTSETVVSDVKEELKPGDTKWFLNLDSWIFFVGVDC